MRASAVRLSGEMLARASGCGSPTVTVVPPGAVRAYAVSKARAEPAGSGGADAAGRSGDDGSAGHEVFPLVANDGR